METHTTTFLIKTYIGTVGDTLRTVFFGLAVTLAIIIFADVSQYRLALSAFIITLAVFGILRSRGAIDMLSNVAKDISEELAGSNFGKAFASTPFNMFKIVIAVLLIATAGAQIWSLWY